MSYLYRQEAIIELERYKMNTEQKLDQLTQLQGILSAIQSGYMSERNEILSKVQSELDALDQYYQPSINQYSQEIERLTQSIKDDVIDQGKTIKSNKLMAVYTKPRITWDTKGLEGYMVAHPEIEVFRNIGKASVSIREVK